MLRKCVKEKVKMRGFNRTRNTYQKKTNTNRPLRTQIDTGGREITDVLCRNADIGEAL